MYNTKGEHLDYTMAAALNVKLTFPTEAMAYRSAGVGYVGDGLPTRRVDLLLGDSAAGAVHSRFAADSHRMALARVSTDASTERLRRSNPIHLRTTNGGGLKPFQVARDEGISIEISPAFQPSSYLRGGRSLYTEEGEEYRKQILNRRARQLAAQSIIKPRFESGDEMEQREGADILRRARPPSVSESENIKTDLDLKLLSILGNFEAESIDPRLASDVSEFGVELMKSLPLFEMVDVGRLEAYRANIEEAQRIGSAYVDRELTSLTDVEGRQLVGVIENINRRFGVIATVLDRYMVGGGGFARRPIEMEFKQRVAAVKTILRSVGLGRIASGLKVAPLERMIQQQRPERIQQRLIRAEDLGEVEGDQMVVEEAEAAEAEPAAAAAAPAIGMEEAEEEVEEVAAPAAAAPAAAVAAEPAVGMALVDLVEEHQRSMEESGRGIALPAELLTYRGISNVLRQLVAEGSATDREDALANLVVLLEPFSGGYQPRQGTSFPAVQRSLLRRLQLYQP